MVRKIVYVVVILLVLLGVGYALIPNARDEAQDLSSAVISDAAPVDQPSIQTDGGVEVPLSADNTTVSFSCAKTVAGKTLLVRGGWSGKFQSVIEGTATLDAGTHQPLTLRAKARIDTLWSEHDQLTEALLTMGFFRPDEHPWATFEGVYEPASSEPAADPADGAAPTGRIVGSFELNGITRQIAFPVKYKVTKNTLILTSAFSLDRHAFDVTFKEVGGFGLLTDEDIADDVAIRLNIEAPLANGQDAQLAECSNEDKPGDATAQPIPVEDLPKSFTELTPATQVQFDMVLVTGDPQKGVSPFYIGKHEVTWDEFMPWVQGGDLADEALVGEERALKLRPSSPYGSVDRNFGMYRRPALGMSRMSAELYCKWLSEQTGRHYRLPTEDEWEYAYNSGGPVEAPASSSEADTIATYQDNAWDDSIGDWATTKIGSREPNELGLYDMAGNVAEWVTDTGDEYVVRGGHFESPIDELGVGRAAEDMDEWNRDYPNEPKSQWWYVNARWVGFRVACDPLPIGDDGP